VKKALRGPVDRILCLVTLAVAGCGSLPTAPEVPPAVPRPPSPPPQPGLPRPNLPAETAFRQSLNTYLQTIGAEAPSFEARYVTEEKYKGEYRKSTYLMRFQQRPRISLLEVIDSTQIPTGFKVRDTGGEKVKVRLPGAISFISMEVPARSTQSRSLMGLYPNDVTPEKFIQALTDPETQVREVPGRMQDGRPLRVLEAMGPRTILPGAKLTVGLGENPRFAYHLAITRPDGSTHTQTFSRFQPRKFDSSELSL
jgi:hypothetical protein